MKRNLRLAILLMIATFSSQGLSAQCTLSFTNITTNSNCGASTGSASVTPANGTPPFTYAWSNGGSTQTIVNVAAGIYSVTITDALGCTGTGYVTVNNPNAPTVNLVSSSDITCYGLTDGSATIAGSGGTTPYSAYLWSPSNSTTSTVTDLTAGDHFAYIYDAAWCMGSLLVTINEPAELTSPTGQASQTFCDLSTMTVADLNATGATINWYDAATNGSMYTGSEALVSGNSYFASQSTSATCESAQRLEVMVGEYVAITDITPTSPGSVCVSGATTVSVPNSQTGINYYLKNNGMIVDGPVAGTGSTITLNTGTVSSVTTFEVYAENDNTTDVKAKGLRFTGNAGLKKVELGTDLWDNEFDGNTEVTVEAWINRTTTGSLQTILGNYQSGFPLMLRIDQDHIRFFINSTQMLYGNAPLPVGTWTHVAGTYDGTEMKVYVNGVMQNSMLYSAPLESTTNVMKIGGGLDNNTEYFPGDIAEVRFWNVARTDTEISAMYNKQLIGNENGLVAYYQFEEGTGTTTANSASSGLYSGTLVNSPEWIDATDIAGANCYLTMSQDVTISIDAAVTADAPSDVNECGNYLLPALTTGDYYTGAGGTGTMLPIGNALSTSQTLYVYAANGACTDENSFDITIDTPVSADAPGDVTECGEYELPALTIGDYYTATNAGGTQLTAGSIVASTATIFVYAANGTCTDENSFDVTINDLPDNAVTQNAETLTADLSGAQYQWLDCNNNDAEISGEIGQAFTATSNGNYAVEITMNGCVDTSACYVIASTDVAYFNGSEISVYPNPSNGMINVNFSKVLEGEIKLYDAVGKLVVNLPITKLNEQINLVDQTEGIYFMVIESQDFNQTIRVVLE